MMRTREELTTEFDRLGIPYTQPGFYDHTNFAAVERNDPAFLERYAEFVDLASFTPDYLEKVRRIVPEVACFLYRKLVEDGRLGACIDANTVFTRFLEREGVWNYLVGGSVAVDYGATTDLDGRHWRHLSHPSNPVAAGHAWICAPPYKVVDITITRQLGVTEQEHQLIGDYLMEERFEQEGVTFDIHDIMDPECWLDFGHPPPLHLVYLQHPGIRRVLQRFKPFTIRRGDVTLKYMPCKISAPTLPFHQSGTFCFSGKPPLELYAEYKAQTERRSSAAPSSSNVTDVVPPPPTVNHQSVESAVSPAAAQPANSDSEVEMTNPGNPTADQVDKLERQLAYNRRLSSVPARIVTDLLRQAGSLPLLAKKGTPRHRQQMDAARQILADLLPTGTGDMTQARASGWIGTLGTANWDRFLAQAARDQAPPQSEEAFRQGVAQRIAAAIA
jgi:hypothetical protein